LAKNSAFLPISCIKAARELEEKIEKKKSQHQISYKEKA
jgi:hypothetical protein